jgi:8-oxo-dGTP diphosphatase
MGGDIVILPTHIVGAGGVIFNNKDEILLVKNPRKGWEYPGGMVEQGETVPQGLIREIKEETLNIVNEKQIYRLKKALEYKNNIYCSGYHVNSNNELEVQEEYFFNR